MAGYFVFNILALPPLFLYNVNTFLGDNSIADVLAEEPQSRDEKSAGQEEGSGEEGTEDGEGNNGGEVEGNGN